MVSRVCLGYIAVLQLGFEKGRADFVKKGTFRERQLAKKALLDNGTYLK